MTTLVAKTACDTYDTTIPTSRTAPQTARAAALELVQAINPSITLTPLTFTRTRLRTVPTALLFDGPWNTHDLTNAIEAPITSWKLTPTAPPSPSLRQPPTDRSEDVHCARFGRW